MHLSRGNMNFQTIFMCMHVHFNDTWVTQKQTFSLLYFILLTEEENVNLFRRSFEYRAQTIISEYEWKKKIEFRKKIRRHFISPFNQRVSFQFQSKAKNTQPYKIELRVNREGYMFFVLYTMCEWVTQSEFNWYQLEQIFSVFCFIFSIHVIFSIRITGTGTRHTLELLNLSKSNEVFLRK